MTKHEKRGGQADVPLDRPFVPRVRLNPGLLTGSTDDEILRSFLDLVRTWRGGTKQTALRLRQADIAVLVSILGTDSAEIERRLVAATACTPKAARRGRRVLLASIGTLSLGLTSLTGATVAGALTATNLPPSTLAAPVTAPAVANAPVAAAPAADPVPPAPAVEQAMPVAAAQPAETSEAALPVGVEAMLSIASVGIDQPIVLGGQSVIDQGVVAHYTAPGWEAAVAPGAPGTYWLAAHHESHGQPFAALPDVAVGAEVRVTTSAQTFVYTVTSTEVVGLQPGDEAVYGSDPTAAVILLQTCIDNTRRFLVHGTLTATIGNPVPS